MKPETPKAFFDWIEGQLQTRGWSERQLLRRAGLTGSILSKARTGLAIGWDAAIAIAKALNEPPENVMRLAGLLPDKPNIAKDTEEMNFLMGQMEDYERIIILKTARSIAETKGKYKCKTDPDRKSRA